MAGRSRMTLPSKCFEREMLRFEAQARFAHVNLVAESYQCKLFGVNASSSVGRPRRNVTGTAGEILTLLQDATMVVNDGRIESVEENMPVPLRLKSSPVKDDGCCPDSEDATS